VITKIKIEGYKSIKNQTIDLKPINILLGANGVGKSNFISIFSLIRNIYNQSLQSYVLSKGGADSFLHFGRKKTTEIRVNVLFGNDKKEINQFAIALGQSQNSLLIKSVSTAFNAYDSGRWSETIYEKNQLESGFSRINTGQAFWVNQRLLEFDVYHFHDTSDQSPMKGIADIGDNRTLKRDGSNIAAYLYFLKVKHPNHFKRIEMTIQSVAPFFDHFVLEPYKLNESKINLEWREKGAPDSYFSSYHLSDGTLRFICLATLLMQPKPPKTIIIDEPELGLHPVAVNKLASLVRKISENTQVILSTQSVNLVDNFSTEDIIVTDRGSDGTVFRRLDSHDLKSWLDSYTLGDLWGKNIIGAQPYSI
jgi:predicted ATPase